MRYSFLIELDDTRLRTTHLLTGRHPRSGEPLPRLDAETVAAVVRDVLRQDGRFGVARCDLFGFGTGLGAPLPEDATP